jgi:hypothetical protein
MQHIIIFLFTFWLYESVKNQMAYEDLAGVESPICWDCEQKMIWSHVLQLLSPCFDNNIS